jgi:hypothetical protein
MALCSVIGDPIIVTDLCLTGVTYMGSDWHPWGSYMMYWCQRLNNASNLVGHTFWQVQLWNIIVLSL